MAIITYDDETVHTVGTAGLSTNRPGSGTRGSPVFWKNKKVTKVVTGVITGDSSYPTGGEDISNIFGLFTTCQGIVFTGSLDTADTGKIATVDYTNQKVKLYTAIGTELGNTVTWANTTIRFLAYGI